MAMEATRMNYMDSSVEFLKGIEKIVKKRTDKMEAMKFSVKNLKKRIIEIHNNMVVKRKKRVGIDFRGMILSIGKIYKVLSNLTTLWNAPFLK